MDGPGTITWEEFLEDAEKFIFVSDRMSDGWELRGDKVYTALSPRNFIIQEMLDRTKNIPFIALRVCLAFC